MTTPQDPRRRPGDQDHRLHDVDLVAAYAGEDPEVDRNAAAALVAACPDCRSEFSLQRDVAMWMSGAPVVTLDDHERAVLHDRVGSGIAGSAVVSLTDRRSRRQPGQILFRIASAAAAVAVVAGLGGVFGNVGGDNDGGDSFQTVSAELSAASEEDATTAAAGATTTIAIPFGAGGSLERAMLAGGDAEVVKREIEELIAQAVDANADLGVPEEAQADEMNATPPCASSVEGRQVLLTAESALDGEPIIVFVVSADVAAGTSPDVEAEAPEALVFKIADCSVADLG
ncbi:MAG TPA: hypothetical protein VM848_05005 [Acidimicrobiia bacterium]|nr:hypothetical protein [Acidimicrobiia bacterium]